VSIPSVGFFIPSVAVVGWQVTCAIGWPGPGPAKGPGLATAWRCQCIVEGRALLHLFLVFLVSCRRVPLQQRRESHVAIKAQDIRAGPQRSL